MRHTKTHARRRALILALPTILIGGLIYTANALPINGAGAAGMALMVTAALAALLDLEHPNNH